LTPAFIASPSARPAHRVWRKNVLIVAPSKWIALPHAARPRAQSSCGSFDRGECPAFRSRNGPSFCQLQGAKRAALAGLGDGIAAHRRRRRGLPWHTRHSTHPEGNAPSLRVCLLLSFVQGPIKLAPPNAGAQFGPDQAKIRSLLADLAITARCRRSVTNRLHRHSGRQGGGVNCLSHDVFVVSQQIRRFSLKVGFSRKVRPIRMRESGVSNQRWIKFRATS
jgi:hypothetical protein